MKRKLLIILLSIACIFSLAFGLAACGLFNRTYEFTISAVVGGKRYNDNIKYRLSYTSDEECPNGNIDNEKLYTDMDFEVGKVYYMAVDFTVSSFYEYNWHNSFINASFKVAQSEEVEVRLEEVATGNVSEKVEDNSTVITVTFSIPENRTESRTYRMIIRFVLQSQKDYITTYFAFYGNSQSSYYDEKLILLKSTEGLTFNLLENKQGYEVGLGNTSETDIFIPEYYNDLPVTRIKDSGFKNSIIENISISDIVTAIGDRAFENCTGLTSITIPNSVTEIGGSAFNGCTAEIIWGSNPQITKIGYNAFNGYNGTGITIPTCVISIGNYTFQDCTNLESVTFSNNSQLTSIGDSSFKNCESLTSITIPESVFSIGESAFFGCTSLTSVIFDHLTNIHRWQVATLSDMTDAKNLYSTFLANPRSAASYLTSTYCEYYWYRIIK